MTTSIDGVANLSEQELLDYFTNLVARARRTTANLLIAIAEIDERKLWATHACSSMFTFCMERFHMSEQVTAKRLWAARTARRFPVILEMVARGELHLGAIHLLAKHLTDENHSAVLERARHQSSREIERLIAELAPRADVPSRIRALPGVRQDGLALTQPTGTAVPVEVDGTSNDRPVATGREDTACAIDLPSPAKPEPELARPTLELARRAPQSTRPESATVRKPIVPLSPRRYKIEITVDESTHDKLRSLQDLLARSGAGRDPAEIISRAIDVLLDRTLARKVGCADGTKQACDDQPNAAATSRLSRIDSRGRMPSTFDVVAARRGPRSRTIPAAVRREVWRRDSGRCCYVDASGIRCRATSCIEFHHRTPFAVGGPSTAGNIELRCAAHNQLQADLDFGRSFMEARRGSR